MIENSGSSNFTITLKTLGQIPWSLNSGHVALVRFLVGKESSPTISDRCRPIIVGNLSIKLAMIDISSCQSHIIRFTYRMTVLLRCGNEFNKCPINLGPRSAIAACNYDF